MLHCVPIYLCQTSEMVFICLVIYNFENAASIII